MSDSIILFSLIILTFFIFLEMPGIFEIVGGTIVVGSVYLIHLENKKKA